LQSATGGGPAVDISSESFINAVAFHPDCRQFAAVDQNGLIKIRRIPDGSEVRSLQVPQNDWNWRYALAFDRQGTRLAAAGAVNTIYVWNLNKDDQPAQLAGLRDVTTDVAFSPGGQSLAAADMYSTVVVWDTVTGAIRYRMVDAGRRARFNHDGSQLATADDRTKTIQIWDMSDGRQRLRIRGGFNCLDCSPDGRRIASASFDGSVKIWDVAQASDARQLGVEMAFGPHVIAFDSDGGIMVPDDSETLTENRVTAEGGQSMHTFNRKVLSFWDPETGERAKCVPTEAINSWVRDLATGGQGTWFATVESSNGNRGDPSCKVIVRDSKTGDTKLTIERPPEDRLYAVAASPDGTRLAFGGHKQLVEIVSAMDGQTALRIPVRGLRLAYSPRGDLLAATSWLDDLDGRVTLCDAATGAPVRTLLVKDYRRATAMGDVAFSPDGRHVAAAGRNGKANFIAVWDVASGEQKFTLLGHAEDIQALAYSPDGTRLASASKDESLILWDQLGRRVLTLPSAIGEIYEFAFSPDGRRIAAIGYRGVQVWDSGPKGR
jgi:WD40 repeat protein